MTFQNRTPGNPVDVERKAIRVRTNRLAARIERPSCPCGNPKTEIHHPNYDNPFEVAFLCKRCHVAEHQGKLWFKIIVVDLRLLVRTAA